MEEVKILIFALVSFLSQEDIPIGAKSAEIEINTATKQIVLHQNDIYSLEQYAQQSKVGLDSLMRATTLVADLFPLEMTSKHFYEEDGKLNAILHLRYDDLKDLRKISFYSDVKGNLSYPNMQAYTYELQTGRADERYIRFNANTDVKFKMQRKELLFDGIYSLLEDWKALEVEKYRDVSDVFSKKDFEKLRKFIFKNGDRHSFRNYDNNNPHYRFDDFDVYLGTGDQRSVFKNNELKPKDYTELVIWGKGYYTLYLSPGERSEEEPNLKKAGVYWRHGNHQDIKLISLYLKKMKLTLK